MNKCPILICGVDEAGRGPLAGPVFAACVILNKRKRIKGLADSKALTKKQRDELRLKIEEKALAWSIASASVEEIEKLNILQASLLAMRRAVQALHLIPDEVLVDGIHCPQWSYRSKAIIDGDNTVAEISAASILAKTARDETMVKWHQRFPEYGFDQHKGYSTREHLEALQLHGACEIHRKTFAPVRQILFGLESNDEYFQYTADLWE